MAEFQEVMQQWGRLCMQHAENNDDCDGCLLGDTRAGVCCAYAKDNAEFVTELERLVMEWATEHPEPIYPTWGEFLAEKGELCKNWKDIRVVSSAGNSAIGVIGWFYKNVPADIAEKLGIEPKEG